MSRPAHHATFDDDRTTLVPQVPVQRFPLLRFLLPWMGFGLAAVIVVTATTALSSSLKGPDAPLSMTATPPAVTVPRAPAAGTAAGITPAEMPAEIAAVDEPTTVAQRRRATSLVPARKTPTPAPVPPAVPTTTLLPSPTVTTTTAVGPPLFGTRPPTTARSR